MGFPPKRDSLRTLASRYAGIELPKLRLGRRIGTEVPSRLQDYPLDLLPNVVETSLALLRIYRGLEQAVSQVKLRRPHEPKTQSLPSASLICPTPTNRSSADAVEIAVPCPNPFPPDFLAGLLGTGFDVMALIALGQAARLGIAVDPVGRDAALTMATRVSKAAFESLRLTTRKPLGSPEANAADYGKAYAAMVRRIAGKAVDRMGLPLRLPTKGVDDVAAAIEHWDIVSETDSETKAFIALARTISIAKWLREPPTDVAHPSSEVIGAITSSRPNLGALQQSGTQLFQPRPGHRFLVVELAELDERCLAALCRSWYGRHSRLYDVFSKQSEPLKTLAIQLQDASKQPGYTADLPGKKRRTWPIGIEWWIAATKFLLRSLASGYPLDACYKSLSHDSPLRQLHVNDWDHLARTLCRDVARELTQFTGIELTYPLAANLATTEQQVRNAMELPSWINQYNRPRHDFNQPDADMRVQHELADKQVADVATLFGKNNVERPLGSDFDQQSPADELLKMREQSLGGRITLRRFPADVYRQAWQTLQHDVVKVTAYSLVLAQFRLVATAGRELVLEVEDSFANSKVEAEVVDKCKAFTAMLLGAASPPCLFFWCSSWPRR